MKLCVIGQIVRPHRAYDLFQLLTATDCITVCNMYDSISFTTR